MYYVCEVCGESFEGKSQHANRFCSISCLVTHRANITPDFELSLRQIQYLAGILDAEGNIFSGYRGNAHILHVTIFNTNRNLIDTIQNWAKCGNIYGRESWKNHFGNKQVYRWVCQSLYSTEKFLILLLPYLRVKHDAVEKALNQHVENQPIAWPYVAGFFDGEGSCKPATEYIISITNEMKTVLDEIQSFLGYGHIYKRKNVDVYDLKISTHKQRLQFIESILPNSIVKHAELIAAQQFIQCKDWDMDRWGGHKLAHVTDDELADLYWGKKIAIRPLATRFGVAYNPMYQRMRKISERIGKPLRPLGTNQTFAIRNKELQSN